jgi:hypothetical protein
MATTVDHQGFDSCIKGTSHPLSGRVGANLSGTLSHVVMMRKNKKTIKYLDAVLNCFVV